MTVMWSRRISADNWWRVLQTALTVVTPPRTHSVDNDSDDIGGGATEGAVTNTVTLPTLIFAQCLTC